MAKKANAQWLSRQSLKEITTKGEPERRNEHGKIAKILYLAR
jgi:hypothetical protein